MMLGGGGGGEGAGRAGGRTVQVLRVSQRLHKLELRLPQLACALGAGRVGQRARARCCTSKRSFSDPTSSEEDAIKQSLRRRALVWARSIAAGASSRCRESVPADHKPTASGAEKLSLRGPQLFSVGPHAELTQLHQALQSERAPPQQRAMDPFSSIHDTLPGAEGAKKSSTAKDEPKLSITELVSKARRQSKIEEEDIDEEDRERRENSRNSDYLHDMTAHEGHAHAVFCLAFHPEGRLLLSASGDKTVKLWDLQTHKVLATFPEHEQWVYSVAFMHKSMAFATGCDDGRVRIFDNHSEPINHETGWKLTCDLGQGGKHDAANGHRAGVQSVDVSRDDAYVVSGSADMTIKVCALILPP